jgi:hypothetical protein
MQPSGVSPATAMFGLGAVRRNHYRSRCFSQQLINLSRLSIRTHPGRDTLFPLRKATISGF